jgi:hypothetical protein
MNFKQLYGKEMGVCRGGSFEREGSGPYSAQLTVQSPKIADTITLKSVTQNLPVLPSSIEHSSCIDTSSH